MQITGTELKKVLGSCPIVRTCQVRRIARWSSWVRQTKEMMCWMQRWHMRSEPINMRKALN